MSTQKPTSLRGFVAAASLSTLLASASAYSTQEETETSLNNHGVTETQVDTSTSFTSDATSKTYGKYIDYISQYTPGLTFMVLTPDDLTVKLTTEELDALKNSAGCHPLMPLGTTEHGVTALLKIEAASEEIMHMIKSYAETDTPIIEKEVLIDTLYNNPTDFTLTVNASAGGALTGNAMSVSFTNEITSKAPVNFAIITMPSQFDKTEYIRGISGLPTKFLENFNATTEDWVLDVLAHEIAGHAHNTHTSIKHNAEYNCAKINSEWLDNSNFQESVSDIIASNIYRDGQKDGLASNADFPKEKEALRALGALYMAPNTASISNTHDVNDHVTTLIFDTDAPEYMSNLDNTNTSTLPATINRLADAMTGYVTLVSLKEELKNKPDEYPAEQHAYIKSISLDPKDFEKQMDGFAYAGQEKRLGALALDGVTPIPAEPQWHYAAIAFIHKHDLLKGVKDEIEPQYAAAIDDLIQDFIEAADRHASKLKNPEIIEKMDNVLKAEYFEFLDFNAFIGVQEEATTTAAIHPAPGV